MSLYTCFDWFKKLRLSEAIRRSQGVRAVVIRRFSLDEAP